MRYTRNAKKLKIVRTVTNQHNFQDTTDDNMAHPEAI